MYQDTSSFPIMASRRALHFVFKIGQRAKNVHFYRDILGMTFLRHEEFDEGCPAACNGPYAGKWSKSMVGYGNEDDNFVVELTYNYGIDSYARGNDFRGITIYSGKVLKNAETHGWPVEDEDGKKYLQSPDGYRFYIMDQEEGDTLKKVSLSVSDLKRSIDYWSNKCAMKIFEQNEKSAVLGFSEDQCQVELVAMDGPIDRAKAYGRIAFSCPKSQQEGIESMMKSSGETILTPLTRLDTPGKTTVSVVILADPDGHEICFVEDEGFRELSKPDENADQMLEEALTADKSDEWFAKKGISKAEAQA